jgi:hypothetical protein
MEKDIRFINFFAFCLILTIILSGYSQIPQESGDLKNEIISIRNNMPGSGSDGFVKPLLTELSDWREIISAMLDGEYLDAGGLIQDKFPYYELILFTDTSFQNKEYYLLKEKSPISKGWGTFIINPHFDREIMIEVPHARYDTDTHEEGIDVFRYTGSHYFIMSGTHRCANSEESLCSGTTSACGSSGPYRVSDMPHFDQALFQVIHEEVTIRHPQLYSIQIHGHAQSTCEDFFMSNGHATLSNPIVANIKNSLLASGDVTAAVAGDGFSACNLVASTNVQGRFTNGSSYPCVQAVSSTTGYFIHIEQSYYVRSNPSVYAKLTDAINENITPVTGIRHPTEMMPDHLDLISIYPNPFNPSTTIKYNVIKNSLVSLKIYDAIGREVETVVRRQLPIGNYYYQFNGSQKSSGVYYARIQFSNFNQTMKFTLLK